MPATLESHLTALFNAINGQVSVSGVTITYYNFEPPAQHMNLPVAITVSWVETTPDFYRLRVRVHVDASSDPSKAATLVRTITTAVDNLLPDEFGPSAWVSDLSEEQDFYISQAILEAGREDF